MFLTQYNSLEFHKKFPLNKKYIAANDVNQAFEEKQLVFHIKL